MAQIGSRLGKVGGEEGFRSGMEEDCVAGAQANTHEERLRGGPRRSNTGTIRHHLRIIGSATFWPKGAQTKDSQV